jgi:hypothetical protein
MLTLLGLPCGSDTISLQVRAKKLENFPNLILCAIHPPEAIKKILDCLGIPSKPPPIFPALLESDTEESGIRITGQGNK